MDRSAAQPLKAEVPILVKELEGLIAMSKNVSQS